MAKLLISEQYLKETTVIGDNVDMKILTPVVEWVQDIYILPLLGHDLYELLLSEVPSSLSPVNETLVNDYLLKAMRFYILSESVRTFKYRYTNKGIMTATSENGTSINKDEAEELIDDWKSKGQTYGQLMINFIKDNIGDYPSYNTVNGTYRVRHVDTAYDCPIYLPTNYIPKDYSL